MSSVEGSIIYFESAGKHNTDAVLKTVKGYAERGNT